MGYSITQEQYEKLQGNIHAGRQCGMSTGKGGCYAPATVAALNRSWNYKIGEGTPRLGAMVFCKRHVPRETGVNFETLATEPLPARRCPYCKGTDTAAVATVGYDYSDAETDQLGFETGTPVLDTHCHCRECGENY